MKDFFIPVRAIVDNICFLGPNALSGSRDGIKIYEEEYLVVLGKIIIGNTLAWKIYSLTLDAIVYVKVNLFSGDDFEPLCPKPQYKRDYLVAKYLINSHRLKHI